MPTTCPNCFREFRMIVAVTNCNDCHRLLASIRYWIERGDPTAAAQRARMLVTLYKRRKPAAGTALDGWMFGGHIPQRNRQMSAEERAERQAAYDDANGDSIEFNSFASY